MVLGPGACFPEAPTFNALDNTDHLSLPNLDQYVAKSNFCNCVSIVSESRELPLAIAEDSEIENILNSFSNKKARKVFF